MQAELNLIVSEKIKNTVKELEQAIADIKQIKEANDKAKYKSGKLYFDVVNRFLGGDKQAFMSPNYNTYCEAYRIVTGKVSKNEVIEILEEMSKESIELEYIDMPLHDIAWEVSRLVREVCMKNRCMINSEILQNCINNVKINPLKIQVLLKSKLEFVENIIEFANMRGLLDEVPSDVLKRGKIKAKELVNSITI